MNFPLYILIRDLLVCVIIWHCDKWLPQQAWWSKYLFQFNLVIRFYPGYLSIKPNTLTRWWDIYPKEGNTSYATVNPHNFKSIFTQEQLTVSIWATVLLFPSLYVAIVVNLDNIHWDILSALSSNPIASKHISTDSQWSMDSNGLLLLDNRIYVLISAYTFSSIIMTTSLPDIMVKTRYWN